MMTQRDYEVWFCWVRLWVMGFFSFKNLALLAGALVFSCAGCAPSAPRGDGSLLIITISNFRADDLTCGLSGDSITPQLDKICNESVRFTHAYTPSVLSIPALASIFTGLYPVEHGVHRNGASNYSPDIKNLAQMAREKGLETFFVSGGVPALRKTAISKGFTDFDDTIRTNGSFYRKATDTVSKLISLIESRSEEAPFFAVAHLVDLAFPEDVLFKTNREEGAGGKLQEIDEALGDLRSEFVRQKIWDPLTVVIVGLQGNERAEHSGLSKGINLYDEIVRVPLLIKPSRKPRDQGPSWKVDDPVTLVDLGVTLIKLLGVKDPLQSKFPTLDFLESLKAHDLHSVDRPLFTESDLPAWRGWGPRLVSARVGEWLYWLPPDPKLFNTYTDHLELRNLFSIDPNSTLRLQKLAQNYLPLLNLKDADAKNIHLLPYSIGDKLRVARNLFSKTTSAEEKTRSLTELQMRRPDDWQVVQWQVALFAETQDWTAIKETLAHRAMPKDQSDADDFQLWQTFLELKLHLKPKEDHTFLKSKNNPFVNCLYLALALKRFSLSELDYFQNQQSCKDPETQAWVNAFIHANLKQTKEAGAFFDLARGFTEKRMEQSEFARAFWSDGAVWDYNVALPEGPAVFSLFTALVNNLEFLEFIKKKQFP